MILTDANSYIDAQHDSDHEEDIYFYLHERLGSVSRMHRRYCANNSLGTVRLCGSAKAKYNQKLSREVSRRERTYNKTFGYFAKRADKKRIFGIERAVA